MRGREREGERKTARGSLRDRSARSLIDKNKVDVSIVEEQ